MLRQWQGGRQGSQLSRNGGHEEVRSLTEPPAEAAKVAEATVAELADENGVKNKTK